MTVGKECVSLAFLPTFKKEADEVVRQVEVLGKDPLTVMQQRGGTTLNLNFIGTFWVALFLQLEAAENWLIT